MCSPLSCHRLIVRANAPSAMRSASARRSPSAVNAPASPAFTAIGTVFFFLPRDLANPLAQLRADLVALLEQPADADLELLEVAAFDEIPRFPNQLLVLRFVRAERVDRLPEQSAVVIGPGR